MRLKCIVHDPVKSIDIGFKQDRRGEVRVVTAGSALPHRRAVLLSSKTGIRIKAINGSVCLILNNDVHGPVTFVFCLTLKETSTAPA